MLIASSKSDKEMTSLDLAHDEIGPRLAAHLRSLYPKHAAKRLATDFGVEEVTARGWLAGKRPSNRHMDRMFARWGRAFFDFLYAPIAGATDIDSRLDRVAADVAALQAELRRARDAEAARRVA
ncbi:hypothetical protein [Inquilinus limosus]|uniref:XRE family transcriptional regulator n=1 Tax=Inquilinus limosus TaxID=171674 RepID=A0A211ZQ73_9PROT|nr:hypothetical protein [Inquilinus limosus]OWJ67431.1 hypothetical protein BWR60_09500 [Inquilinus limosus]